MAKTKEELDELKKEFETLKSKLQDLSQEELEQIAGGRSKEDELFIPPSTVTLN